MDECELADALIYCPYSPRVWLFITPTGLMNQANIFAFSLRHDRIPLSYCSHRRLVCTPAHLYKEVCHVYFTLGHSPASLHRLVCRALPVNILFNLHVFSLTLSKVQLIKSIADFHPPIARLWDWRDCAETPIH